MKTLEKWLFCIYSISCIAALSVITAWSIYGIFAKWRHRIAIALGLLFLLSIPASLAISSVPACFVESIHVDIASDILHIAISLLLSAICFVIDFVKTHSTRVIEQFWEQERPRCTKETR